MRGKFETDGRQPDVLIVLAVEIFGSAASIAGFGLRVKHMERVEYMRHVCDWEIRNHLAFF